MKKLELTFYLPLNFKHLATNPDICNDTRPSTCDATPWIISTTVFGSLMLVVGLYHLGKCCWKRGKKNKKKKTIAAT